LPFFFRFKIAFTQRGITLSLEVPALTQEHDAGELLNPGEENDADEEQTADEGDNADYEDNADDENNAEDTPEDDEDNAAHEEHAVVEEDAELEIRRRRTYCIQAMNVIRPEFSVSLRTRSRYNLDDIIRENPFLKPRAVSRLIEDWDCSHLRGARKVDPIFAHTHNHSLIAFHKLPVELILEISDSLSPLSRLVLQRVCHRFRTCLAPTGSSPEIGNRLLTFRNPCQLRYFLQRDRQSETQRRYETEATAVVVSSFRRMIFWSAYDASPSYDFPSAYGVSFL
jgi:hypothetical protein